MMLKLVYTGRSKVYTIHNNQNRKDTYKAIPIRHYFTKLENVIKVKTVVLEILKMQQVFAEVETGGSGFLEC